MKTLHLEIRCEAEDSLRLRLSRSFSDDWWDRTDWIGPINCLAALDVYKLRDFWA